MAAKSPIELLSDVDGIPSVGFCELQAELYYLKENIANKYDSDCLQASNASWRTHHQPS